MKEFQDISVDGVRQYMGRHQENEYILVDVRQPDEYTHGHIPGAVHMPLGQLQHRLSELPLDKDIIFYCRSGKRSQAAAVMVGSQPLIAGTLFNMVGGIMAWDGHMLPDEPHLTVYDLDKKEDELLLQAMNLERGAERFYLAVRERFASLPWGEALQQLAGAEEAHARMIYKQWAQRQEKAESFTTVYTGLTGDIVEGGYSCQDLLAYIEGQPGIACRGILEMALVVECSAYDLSRNMAHHFQGTSLEEVFQSIAHAEKEHMQIAAKALELC